MLGILALAAFLTPPAAAAAPEPSPLLRSLLVNVRLKDDPDPRAKPFLLKTLETVLSTPTGRELARAFVGEHRSAEVGLASVDASRVDEIGGRKTLAGSGGFTTVRPDGLALVSLNRGYLDAEPEFRRVEAARALAHELFGHGLEGARALEAGVPTDVYRRFRDDEANASQVGWLVQAELGGRLMNEAMWEYLADPEKFHRTTRFQTTIWAQGLSRAQMGDPVAAWREGLTAAAAERARLDRVDARYRFWLRVMDHFVSVHGMEAGRFQALRTGARDSLETFSPQLRKETTDAEASLRRVLDDAQSPAGRRLIAALQAAASSDYLREFDLRLDRGTARLRGLVGTRTERASLAPSGGGASWEELESLWRGDAPEHRRAFEAEAASVH